MELEYRFATADDIENTDAVNNDAAIAFYQANIYLTEQIAKQEGNCDDQKYHI